MVEQQTHLADEKFQSCDETYLAEMTTRISRLRVLHRKMENKQEPMGWLKTLSE